MENTKQKRKNPFKNKKFVRWFIFILIIVIIGTVLLVMKLTDKGQQVSVEKVKKANVLEYYDTTAILKSGEDDTFILEEGIKPSKIYFKVGDEVKKGDKLADLDTSSMNALINEKYDSYVEATNRYNEFVKSYNELTARVSDQSSIIQTAQSSTMSTQNVLLGVYKQLMNTAYNDYQEAVSNKAKYKNGLVANFDGVVTDINMKEGAEFEASGNSADSSLSSIMSSLSGLDSSSSDVSAAIAAVTGASQNQTMSGIAMVVEKIDSFYAEFSLGKYDSQLVKTGMPVTIEFLDTKYTGLVSYISATAENSDSALTALTGGSSSSNSLIANVSFDKPDKALIIGFDVSISILINESKNAVTIPIEALIIEEGKNYVYLYDSETKTAKKKEITVGISSDKLYEVKKGVSVGNVVITNPTDVSDGMKVYEGE